ncbi:MAG: hypothetical protein LBB89_10645 [Treponema sp.]|jgi:hypothetical protein|nr:hypothetical protein [Treponema sp.]
MNMKRIAFLALGFMVFGVSVYAQTAAKVYISGSYLDGVTEKACYWVDGKRVDLPEGVRAIGIAVENGKVYAAGYYLASDSNYRYGQACYWIDGEKYDMKYKNIRNPRNYRFEVTGFAATDGKVYVSGYEQDNMSSSSRSNYYYYLWIDGERTSLSDGSESLIKGITIIDGTACFLYSSSYTFYGQSQSLKGVTTGITAAGGKIYVSGTTGISTSNGYLYTACYWVDGTRVDLPQPSKIQDATDTTGIVVANGTVYVSGQYRQRENDRDSTVACYWANSTKIDLPNGASTSGIAVANGNVYVIGYYKQGNIEIACYWENGVRKPLPGGKTVTGIVVR